MKAISVVGKTTLKSGGQTGQRVGAEVPLKGTVLPCIPDHELLRPIGEGSYGAVWLARNVMGTLRAVKIVRRDGFSDARPYEREYRGIQKFEPLSRSHDGFVDILQIGRNDAEGSFYYVMELADDARRESGDSAPQPSSSDYVPRTLRTEVEAFGRMRVAACVAAGIRLASALQHLHDHGLVHRDIKPSNIIFVNGQPKLADIGLVAELAEARSLVGTVGYIPPEGTGTPQADVYSLGKVLYEISSGKDRWAYPDPPTRLGEFADRDELLELDEVLRKACALDLRERYATAEALRQDLLLLEAGESVRRLHTVERRLARITRASVLAAVLLGVAIPGFLVALYQKHAAVTASQRALVAEAKSRKELHSSYLTESQALRSGHRADKRFAGLELVRKAAEIESGLEVRNEAIACLAIPGIQQLWVRKTSKREPSALDLHAEPYLCARSDAEGNISLRRLEDDVEIARFSGSGSPVYGMWIDPNRRLLGAGYWDPGPQLKIWDLNAANTVFSPSISQFRHLSFSPQGDRAVIVTADGPISLFDLRSQTERWSYKPHLSTPDMTAFDTAGKRIAVATRHEPLVTILDAETGKEAFTLTNSAAAYWAAWQPNGDLLATACGDDNVYLWDTVSWSKRATLAGHENAVMVVAFSHSGRFLVSTGWDGRMRLWDVAVGKEIGSVAIEASEISEMCFSEDERRLGYASTFGMGYYEVAPCPELRLFRHGGHLNNHLWACGFNPSGRTLAVGYDDGVRLWDADSGRQVAFLPMANGQCPLFSPAGDFLLTSSSQGLQKWPVSWAKSKAGESPILGTPELLCAGGETSKRSLARDGKLLALIRDGQFHLFNLATKTDRALPANASIIFKHGCLSPDGRRAAACTESTNLVFIYDTSTATLERTLTVEKVGDLGFSPDGCLLVTCGVEEYRFWRTTNWNCSFTVPRSDTGGFYGTVDFSPDGSMAAIATSSRLIALVDATTGEQLASLEPNDGAPTGYLAFSPDGSRLANSGWNHPVAVWDVRLIRKELAAMHLDWMGGRHSADLP